MSLHAKRTDAAVAAAVEVASAVAGAVRSVLECQRRVVVLLDALVLLAESSHAQPAQPVTGCGSSPPQTRTDWPAPATKRSR